MATFTEIYYNGNEYKQMWLNGSKVWERDSSKIIYPYPDADCVITFNEPSYNTESRFTFNVIDNTLPYCVWATDQPYNKPTTNSNERVLGGYRPSKISFENLKPTTNDSTYHPLTIEQLRLPNLTDLSYLFRNFCYDNSKTYSWQPQYFEFHPNPTSMHNMFYYCFHLTDELMAQFMPYFPNTSEVVSMDSMFYDCQSLTTLDLSSFNTSKVTSTYRMFYDNYNLANLNVSSFDTTNVTDMGYMFGGCSSLTSLDLSSFNTSNLRNVRYMFNNCVSLRTLDLSNFDTRNITSYEDYQYMFQYVKDCTIYIGENWTLGTSSDFGGGSNLTFIRVVPITSITLESTLTDTAITKGTQFTITPTITPTDYSGDELVITYDENYLSMVDNTFTVLDTATIGQQLDITYSSKNNPSVSATYSVTIRDFATIESIVLQHSLESLVIEPNTTFTITPIITPTVHDDELMIEFDNTYITNDNGTFTITNAPFSEQLSIRYYSKLNPTVSATLDLTVREFIPITSIVLTHTLESLTDVAIGTTFTVVPTIEPIAYDDELLVDYDTNYLSKDGDNYTVLKGASGQTVQVIYYSKHDNNVNAMLEFTVEEKAIIVYPYDDADSVITYRNTSTSSQSRTFTIIDNTLPYSINGTNTNKFTFPANSETQVKLINLKPTMGMSTFFPINIEQLRIPNLTDLSYLFYYFCYNSNYEYSWSPQYFEFNENPTNMKYMFSTCKYLTDEMMNQFMPYFPNTSNVTTMENMFSACSSLTSLDLSSFNTSNVTDMSSMFNGCSSLTSLDLSNFDTNLLGKKCDEEGLYYAFSNVSNCTIYINTDKWTLETSSTTGKGTNLTFVPIVVPIKSINGLTIDANDISNVTEQTFTVIPNISPSNYSSDLEVIYDEKYMYIDIASNKVNLKNGSQNMTHTITYRSKSDNSISKSITFTVSQDFIYPTLMIDFSQPVAPVMPFWFKLNSKDSDYFRHGTYAYQSSKYGLVESSRFSSTSRNYWNVYKLVAPTNGTLKITLLANLYKNSSFSIYASTSVSDATNGLPSDDERIYYFKSYSSTSGTATVDIIKGETYYIHFHHYRYRSESSYGVCIKSVELIPTE